MPKRRTKDSRKSTVFAHTDFVSPAFRAGKGEFRVRVKKYLGFFVLFTRYLWFSGDFYEFRAKSTILYFFPEDFSRKMSTKLKSKFIVKRHTISVVRSYLIWHCRIVLSGKFCKLHVVERARNSFRSKKYQRLQMEFRFLLFTALIFLNFRDSASVDRSSFKTCDQSSFCK